MLFTRGRILPEASAEGNIPTQKVERVCNNRIATQTDMCHAELLHSHVVQFPPIIAENVCNFMTLQRKQ